MDNTRQTKKLTPEPGTPEALHRVHAKSLEDAKPRRESLIEAAMEVASREIARLEDIREVRTERPLERRQETKTDSRPVEEPHAKPQPKIARPEKDLRRAGISIEAQRNVSLSDAAEHCERL